MDGIPSFIEKKKFLMDMVILGKMESEFDILGNKVKFRTLDSDENLDSMKETNGYDAATKLLMLKSSLVSKAVVSINGDWMPSPEEARVFLGKLPPIVAEVFWQKYDELKNRRDLLIEQTLIDLKKSSRSPSPASIGDSVNSQNPSGSAPSIL